MSVPNKQFPELRSGLKIVHYIPFDGSEPANNFRIITEDGTEVLVDFVATGLQQAGNQILISYDGFAGQLNYYCTGKSSSSNVASPNGARDSLADAMYKDSGSVGRIPTFGQDYFNLNVAEKSYTILSSWKFKTGDDSLVVYDDYYDHGWGAFRISWESSNTVGTARGTTRNSESILSANTNYGQSPNIADAAGYQFHFRGGYPTQNLLSASYDPDDYPGQNLWLTHWEDNAGGGIEPSDGDTVAMLMHWDHINKRIFVYAHDDTNGVVVSKWFPCNLESRDTFGIGSLMSPITDWTMGDTPQYGKIIAESDYPFTQEDLLLTAAHAGSNWVSGDKSVPYIWRTESDETMTTQRIDIAAIPDHGAYYYTNGAGGGPLRTYAGNGGPFSFLNVGLQFPVFGGYCYPYLRYTGLEVPDSASLISAKLRVKWAEKSGTDSDINVYLRDIVDAPDPAVEVVGTYDPVNDGLGLLITTIDHADITADSSTVTEIDLTDKLAELMNAYPAWEAGNAISFNFRAVANAGTSTTRLADGPFQGAGSPDADAFWLEVVYTASTAPTLTNTLINTISNPITNVLLNQLYRSPE